MSCNALKLNSCEIKGSTFQGRKFDFGTRDISGDTFTAKVKLRNSELTTITGVKTGNEVYFPFTSIENYKADRYNIEYWANFDVIGEEMIAIEDFVISLVPCNGCSEGNQTNFTLNFPEETINYQVSFSIVQVGDYRMTDLEIKEAYERNANTNAFTDSEKSKLNSLPAKDYKEIKGYLYQPGDDSDPQFTIVGGLEIPFQSFLRVAAGEYVLTLSNPVDLDKVFFQNSVSYFENNHPAYTFGESFLIFSKIESTSTELKFITLPTALSYPNSRVDGANYAPFYLFILD